MHDTMQYTTQSTNNETIQDIKQHTYKHTQHNAKHETRHTTRQRQSQLLKKQEHHIPIYKTRSTVLDNTQYKTQGNIHYTRKDKMQDTANDKATYKT